MKKKIFFVLLISIAPSKSEAQSNPKIFLYCADYDNQSKGLY